MFRLEIIFLHHVLRINKIVFFFVNTLLETTSMILSKCAKSGGRIKKSP